MDKLTRSTFGFLESRAPKKKFAQCETCIHFIKDEDQCELHDSTIDIDEDDSCIFYAPGTPIGQNAIGIFSPEETGLVSRQVRCENCMFYDATNEPRTHCDLYTQLNLMQPGVWNLDRYVDEYDCCNAQTDGERDPDVFKPLGPIKHGAGDDDSVKAPATGAKEAMDAAIDEAGEDESDEND